MREYMGVMHADGADSDDDDKSGGDREQMRAQFMGKIHTLLERIVSSEHLPVDAAIDQVMRKNLRVRQLV